MIDNGKIFKNIVSGETDILIDLFLKYGARLSGHDSDLLCAVLEKGRTDLAQIMFNDGAKIIDVSDVCLQKILLNGELESIDLLIQGH